MPKSWDIAPSSPAKGPVKRSMDMPRRSTPAPVVSKPLLAPTRSAPAKVSRTMPTKREAGRKVENAGPRTPLGQKRKKKRRKLILIGFLALLVVLCIAEVILWLPALRVQTVKAEGPNADALQTFIQRDLKGARFFIIPRSSIFFLPEKDIRAHILHAFPNVEAVSIAPAGLTTLTVKTSERASVMYWCGESYEARLPDCFAADATGFIFRQVPPEELNASTTLLAVYTPLVLPLDKPPLGNSFKSPALVPPMIQFVKAIRSLGANVIAVDMRGDEADLYTQAGTRITYVLGHEQQAVALATTAFQSLTLNDGSLEYVDLRFDGKIFFKKKDAVK